MILIWNWFIQVTKVLAQLFASLLCCNSGTYTHKHAYGQTRRGCRHGAKYLITVTLNVILYTGIQTFSRELRSMTRYKPGPSDATHIMFKHFTAGTNCNIFSQWEAVLKEKLNLGHNNVKYYVPVRVKIAIDFSRRPKGFYQSERRLMQEISWIISEGFTEVSGLLSSSVCNFCSSGTAVHPCCAHCKVSLPPLIQTNHLTWHVTRLSPFVWIHVVPCGQHRLRWSWRTGPIRWLMATLYLPWEGSRRVNVSSPLCQQQASQSTHPHWPAQGRKLDFFHNQTSSCLLVPLFCLVVENWSAN